MAAKNRVRVLIVAEFACEQDAVAAHFDEFQSDVESSGTAYSVSRATMDDLDDFTPDVDACNEGSHALFTPILDVEPEDL